MRSSIFLLLTGLLTGGMVTGSFATPQDPPDYIFDPIVVTSTRTPTRSSLIGSTVDVLTGEDLREKGATTLLESLAFIPGLAIARSGEAAGTATLFMRGAKNEHLLVLVDGVAVNDPISPGGTFDWNTLSADAIDRIEVVKGPQSTLYGSDAIAGVINIITQAPEDATSPYLSLETGSYKTLSATAGLSGTFGGLGMRVELSRRQLGGISSAAEEYGNTEPDAWSMWSGALMLEGDTGAGQIKATLRGSRSRFDIDDFGGYLGDDPNSLSWSKDLTGSVSYSFSVRDGWDQRVLLGASRINRWGFDREDSSHPEESVDASYRGVLQSVEWHHTLSIGSQRLATGITYKRQMGRSNYIYRSLGSSTVPHSSQSACAFYLQDQLEMGAMALTIGGRVDSYSDYGAQPTFRLAGVLPFGDIRLRGSFGTGFRAPTIYQRFSPDYGNADLAAETSRGWDAGIEIPIFRRGSVRITRYRQETKQLIDFVTDPVTWASSYQNRGSVIQAGWESTLRVALTGRLGVNAGLTLMEARDALADVSLVRRPKQTVTLGIDYRPGTRWNAALRARYVGEREDIDFSSLSYPPPRIKLDPVTLLDGEITFNLTEEVALRLKLRNITDESPVWVWGFGSPGRAVYLAVLYR